MTAIVPAWTGSDTTRSTWSVIEPTMLSAMIGMPTARSSSAATLMSPPMIEPARTSSRARGRSATARTAAAMFSSPTSGMVSTLIRSPRRLCRSASLTAPSATWATCAPPPTTMIRLPKTRSSARVRWTARMSTSASSAATSASSVTPSTSSSISASGGSPSTRRTVASARIRPPSSATASVTPDSDAVESTMSNRIAAVSTARTPRHQPSEPRPAAPGRRSLTDMLVGLHPAGRVVLLEGRPRGPRTPRGSRPRRRS